MPAGGPDQGFDGSLDRFHRAFAAGDVEAFVASFAEDARVLLHEAPPLVGRAAIAEAFTELFGRVDTSAFRVEHDVVAIHEDRAYVLAAFSEVLRPRGEEAAIEIDGRIVTFWHRVSGGSWLISRVLTGRASPDRVVS